MMFFRKQLSQASKSDERNVSRRVTCQTAFEILNTRIQILQTVSYKGRSHHYFNTCSALKGGCYTHEHELSIFFINTTINNYLVFSSYLVSFVFSSYLVSFVFSSYLVSFITFVASISFELYYKCLLHFFITSVRFTYVQRYPFYVTISVLFTYVKN